MQSGTDGGTPAQSDDREAIYHAVVADLASLIERIRVSLTMIETAVDGEASAALAEVAANVVVLDDVTPRYLKAGEALKARDAGLGMALHLLARIGNLACMIPPGTIIGRRTDRTELHIPRSTDRFAKAR
jgi:hypothetical protein